MNKVVYYCPRILKELRAAESSPRVRRPHHAHLWFIVRERGSDGRRREECGEIHHRTNGTFTRRSRCRWRRRRWWLWYRWVAAEKRQVVLLTMERQLVHTTTVGQSCVSRNVSTTGAGRFVCGKRVRRLRRENVSHYVVPYRRIAYLGPPTESRLMYVDAAETLKFRPPLLKLYDLTSELKCIHYHCYPQRCT